MLDRHFAAGSPEVNAHLTAILSILSGNRTVGNRAVGNQAVGNRTVAARVNSTLEYQYL